MIPEELATCIKEGMKAYWACSECKKMFSDDQGITEITSIEKIEIDANTHDWGEWIVTKEASTLSVGLKTRTCKNEPLHTETIEIPKKVSSGKGGGSSYVKTYKITVKQNANGVISPDTTRIKKGENKKFEIKPNEGYEIVDVLIDGNSVGVISTYVFENVKEEHNIEAIFKKIEITEETWKNPFEDVTEDDWFYEAVKFANENKLFNGVSATEFGASSKMTRGMIVTVLYRYAKAETEKEATFADVEKGSYYSNAIAWLQKTE